MADSKDKDPLPASNTPLFAASEKISIFIQGRWLAVFGGEVVVSNVGTYDLNARHFAIEAGIAFNVGE